MTKKRILKGRIYGERIYLAGFQERRKNGINGIRRPENPKSQWEGGGKYNDVIFLIIQYLFM